VVDRRARRREPLGGEEDASLFGAGSRREVFIDARIGRFGFGLSHRRLLIGGVVGRLGMRDPMLSQDEPSK